MAVVLYPHTESLAVMSRGGGAPIDLVLGLVVGNVAYLLFTIILAMTLGVAPTDVFSGPFSGARIVWFRRGWQSAVCLGLWMCWLFSDSYHRYCAVEGRGDVESVVNMSALSLTSSISLHAPMYAGRCLSTPVSDFPTLYRDQGKNSLYAKQMAAQASGTGSSRPTPWGQGAISSVSSMYAR